ncbi:MAG: M20/M25/M40 family metallo-hydrolase [Streptosporangiaceae bacterium]|jgi:acetylornithine deacetylase
MTDGQPVHDVVALTAALVRIDSVNPSLVTGGAGERELAGFVAGWAAASGLTARLLEGPDGRPSVVIRGGRGQGGRRLMLCGHLDTVGHGSMADWLTPKVAGDRMYGRGAYDMKAGLAAALVACRDAAAAGIAGEVLVAAVTDEEHSSVGVQTVLRHVGADAAIVTEPTELEVAVAHKGFVWSEIEVRGLAAHGSRPHLGLDAIRMTGPVLTELDGLDRALASRPPDPLLGHGSLHASLISGGTEQSTIPGRCTLTVERRTLPGETASDVQAELTALIGRCARWDPRFAARARTLLARDALQTPETEPIVEAVLAGAAGIDGRQREPVGVSFWADSAFLSAAGVPTVLFGPSGDGAHADVEWVSLSSVRTCAEALTAVSLDFCR